MTSPGNATATDAVYVGARVITIDEALPEAEAFWVRDGRFAAVGSAEAVKRAGRADEARAAGAAGAAGTPVPVIDLDGATVVPGFIDAHLHIMPLYHAGSPHEVPDLGPEQVRDIDSLIERMRERARVVPAGQWLIGRSYQDTKLGRHPTRHDLDRISTAHPIRLYHSSFHVSAYNTLALRNAGITRDSPDPAGGAFDRDDSGDPNGVAREAAQGIVSPHLLAETADTKARGV